MNIRAYQLIKISIFILGLTALGVSSASAVPNAPENVIAYGLTPTSVVVKWSNAAPAAASFQVQQSTDGVTFSTIATVLAPKTYDIVTGLTANTAGYYYQVLASDASGNVSPASASFYVSTAGYIISLPQQVGGVSPTDGTGALVTPLYIAANSTSGSYAIVGTLNGTASFGGKSITTTDEMYFIAEFNASGVGQWVETVDESTYSINGVAIDKNGNVATTGTEYNTTNGYNSDLFTSYYNSTGTNVWTHTVTATGTTQINEGYTFWGNAVTFNASGVVYVTGGDNYTDTDSNSINEAIIYSFTAANGTATEVAHFTGSTNVPAADGFTENAEGYDIGINSSGTVVVSGYISKEVETGGNITTESNDLLVRIGSTNYTFAGADPTDTDCYGYSLAIDASKNVFVLADIDTNPTIYKISSTGTIVSGFPVAVDPNDTLITTFSGAYANVDTSGNLWVVNDADFREYAAANGALLWTKYGDPNYPYTPTTLVTGAMVGNNLITVGSILSGDTQIDQFELNPIGDQDMFIAAYSNSNTFSDITTSPSGAISISCVAGSSWCTSYKVTATPSITAVGGGMGSGSQMITSEDNQQDWDSPVDYDPSSFTDIVSPPDGSHQIYVQYMDMYHNWSPAIASNALNFDTTPPTGSITGPTEVGTTAITLTLKATDAGSGMGTGAMMKISNTNASWSTVTAVPYATSYSWTLTSGYGAKTVYVEFQDVAGNWSAPIASNTITLAPTYVITASAGSGGTISPTGSVNVLSGLTQEFTITPAANFEIQQVLKDGVSQPIRNATSPMAVGFADVTASHTISATFVKVVITSIPVSSSSASVS